MCECYAKIRESDPRAEVWQAVVGVDLRVPLKHPIPVNMDGPEGPMQFYEGDPSRLTPDQWAQLSIEMNKKFKVPLASVIEDLGNGRLPIKADGCTISWCEMHSRLAM